MVFATYLSTVTVYKQFEKSEVNHCKHNYNCSDVTNSHTSLSVTRPVEEFQSNYRPSLPSLRTVRKETNVVTSSLLAGGRLALRRLIGADLRALLPAGGNVG